MDNLQKFGEGRKTAIAFSYFIEVGERDFDKSKGIIFIDDQFSVLIQILSIIVFDNKHTF